MKTNYDHHNGKIVKSVNHSGSDSKITFEDGEVVDVPGKISKDIVGQALLSVEGETLVFGMPQPNAPAIKHSEIQGHEAEEEKPYQSEYDVPQGGDDDHASEFEGTNADGLEASESDSEGHE